jgi:hypothetical protein
VKGMLSMLFQRLYVMNLRRSWRNSPGAAWADAIYTLDVLLAFPILSLLGGAWLVATDIFPRTVGRFGIPDAAIVVVAVVVWLGVDIPLSRGMRRFRDERALRDAMVSSADRMKVAAAFAISGVIWILLLAVALVLHHRWNP